MLRSRPSFDALVHKTMAASLLAAGLVTLGGASQTAGLLLHGAGELIVLNDNGAWSWFQDERAVVDPVAGTLLVSSVASSAGTGGATRAGNVEVVTRRLATGDTERSVLHANLQADDHDSAALHVRPDGHYVAMYSQHATDDLSRWRISRQPADAMAWAPEDAVEHGEPVTYSNLYATIDADGNDLLHAFVRSHGRDPTILTSTDHGTTWRLGGRLLDGPGRPYVRYSADGAGRIHVLTTDQHPLDFANGIYHGVIDDGQLQRSDGTVVDGNLLDGEAGPPARLTPVLASGIGRAWTVDLHVDDDGHPYAAFTLQVDTPITTVDQRPSCAGRCYYYARFDGTAWRVHLVADAGSALSRNESFYTGLVALHPDDPDRMFISTDVDPVSGAPLNSATDGRRHHEIFDGVTADGGATWTWRPVTTNSTVDNIRPIVPTWEEDHTALLWLRGTYHDYEHYDLDVVAILTDDTRHDHRPASRTLATASLVRPPQRPDVAQSVRSVRYRNHLARRRTHVARARQRARDSSPAFPFVVHVNTADVTDVIRRIVRCQPQSVDGRSPSDAVRRADLVRH